MSYRVRKKKNSSGSVSIQIIDRKNRGYKVVETIGCSKDEREIEKLYQVALKRIDELENNLFHISEEKNRKERYKEFFASITTDNIIPIGDELIYGRLFDELGCNDIFQTTFVKKIKEKQFLFRSLVISRILYPGSKLYLVDYLEYFKKQTISIDTIYRFLDTLYSKEIKSKIEECIFNHTKKIMNDIITVTFYDVTTLHFESESEDDLRRIGFSKEGKLNRPQIQLGLFTTLQGYPLSFEVYEGNKFEGHTLIDILQKFQDKFHIKNKPIVVADKGMLNSANIAYLENNGYKYILAYKIKNIDNNLKQKIANLTFVDDGVIHTLEIEKEISYKDNNGKKTKAYDQTKTHLDLLLKKSKKRQKNKAKSY